MNNELLIPRSKWTSVVPKAGIRGDVYKGLPFFTSTPKEVNFSRIDSPLVYVHTDPAILLDRQLRESSSDALSDLNYNYAIAQNRPGIFVVRGGNNKCSGSEKLEVLMLLGKDEEPTDTLKDNQRLFQGPVGTFVPKPQLSVGGEASVHVFDLIEYLAHEGYYQGRNDGIFGPFTEQAVFKLQVEIGHPHPNGVFDHKTYALAKQPKVPAFG